MLVKFFATYRQISGCNQCDISGPSSVLELLEEVSRRWPAFRPLVLNEAGTEKGEDAIILVNGRHIEHLEGVRTALSEADYVAFTPLVAGG